MIRFPIFLIYTVKYFQYNIVLFWKMYDRYCVSVIEFFDSTVFSCTNIDCFSLTRHPYRGDAVEIWQYKIRIVRTDNLSFGSGQRLRRTSQHINHVPYEVKS